MYLVSIHCPSGKSSKIKTIKGKRAEIEFNFKEETRAKIEALAIRLRGEVYNRGVMVTNGVHVTTDKNIPRLLAQLEEVNGELANVHKDLKASLVIIPIAEDPPGLIPAYAARVFLSEYLKEPGKAKWEGRFTIFKRRLKSSGVLHAEPDICQLLLSSLTETKTDKERKELLDEISYELGDMFR